MHDTETLLPNSPQSLSIVLCGMTVIIDAEDEARVREKSWTHSTARPFVFRTRQRIEGQNLKMSLQRFILGETRSHVFVFHRDKSRPFDFRKANLVSASMVDRQASMAKQAKTRTTSKYKGVSYSKKSRKWRAGIRPRGLSIFLGEFDRELDAARAYNEAALKYFGENAFQNDLSSL